MTEYEKEAALLIILVAIAFALFGWAWCYCAREIRDLNRIARDLEENRGGSLD